MRHFHIELHMQAKLKETFGEWKRFANLSMASQHDNGGLWAKNVIN